VVPVIGYRARGRTTALITAIAGALGNPWLAALIAFVVVTLLLGVVLPAVWSKKPARTRAARAVLKELRRWLLGQ
jgi:hypothetical protein